MRGTPSRGTTLRPRPHGTRGTGLGTGLTLAASASILMPTDGQTDSMARPAKRRLSTRVPLLDTLTTNAESVAGTSRSGQPIGTSGWATRMRGLLPVGTQIPEAEWRARHRVILIVLAAHAVGLAAFGMWMGRGYVASLVAGVLLGVLAGLAAWRQLGRRFRSSVAALGLVTSSAVLVQFWGGVIEGHFHYFVVVAIVSLYMDWVPFLLAILYVAVDHGLIGSLQPEWVYIHDAGRAEPWKWAGIHATLVLAECAALVVVWRSNEKARAHAELVLRSTGEGLVGVGPDGRITFANPAASTITGVAPDRLVGAPMAQVFPSLGQGASRVQALAPGAGPSSLTMDHQRPDGTPVPLEMVATPIVESGAPTGSVVAIKDITERRRSEQEHARSIQQESEIRRLRELDEFKTLFINTAAHELRTPLTPLKLHLHTLQAGKRGELNPQQQRTLAILTRNLDRLGQLIEEVLDVGRLQAGRLAVEKETVLVNQLVRDVAESFQEVASGAGLSMSCRVDLDLRIDGDPKRLTQVLFNLLENAIKFTPRGGQVQVVAERRGRSVLIQVRDTGMGLRAEDIGKLFTPFTQIQEAVERTKTGSGLGLYISKGLVQLHGGTIEVASGGPGQGAVFTVSLPALPVGRGAPAPGQAGPLAQTAQAAAGGRHVD